MDWIIQHWDELASAAAAAFGLVTIVVGLTPSTKDDDLLRKAGEILSLWGPSNSPTKLKLPGTKPERREQ